MKQTKSNQVSKKVTFELKRSEITCKVLEKHTVT